MKPKVCSCILSGTDACDGCGSGGTASINTGGCFAGALGPQGALGPDIPEEIIEDKEVSGPTGYEGIKGLVGPKGPKGLSCSDCPKYKDQDEKCFMKEKEAEYIDDNPEATRRKAILSINSIEKLTIADNKEGIDLNEGYEFEINGALPEVADAIAKMAIEMDKPENDFGENAGNIFLSLIAEYYDRLKESE